MRFRVWKQELQKSTQKQIQSLMLLFQENAIASFLQLQQKIPRLLTGSIAMVFNTSLNGWYISKIHLENILMFFFS